MTYRPGHVAPTGTVRLLGGPRAGEMTTAHPDAPEADGAYRCVGFSAGVWLYQWHASTAHR